MDNGQQKRRRLSTAGLGTAKQIPSLDRRRNCLLLDRCGSGEAELADALQQILVKPQFREWHATRRPFVSSARYRSPARRPRGDRQAVVWNARRNGGLDIRSQTLHPVLQHVRRRRIVAAIGSQSDFRRMCAAVTMAASNTDDRILQCGGEIWLALSSLGDGNGVVPGLLSDTQAVALGAAVICGRYPSDGDDNRPPPLEGSFIQPRCTVRFRSD